MPVIELFDAAGHVAAPGAYEWWQFAAHDPQTQFRIDLQIHHGLAFHPQYLNRYLAYLRSPTIHRPPVPADYPCVRCSVFQKEKCLSHATVQFPRDSLKFETAKNEIKLGPVRLSLARQVELSVSSGPLPMTGRLIFQPISNLQPIEIVTGQNYWHLYRPSCQVTADLRLAEQSVQFAGLGYLDHSHGAAPLALGLSRWMRGRAITPRGIVAFQVATSQSTGWHSPTLVICDETGTQAFNELNFQIGEEKQTMRGLAYPSSMSFGESFLVRRPRVVHSSPASLNLICDAYLDGEQCQAVIDVEYPRRLIGIFAGWKAARAIRLAGPLAGRVDPQ
jgi:hypothetical protein